MKHSLRLVMLWTLLLTACSRAASAPSKTSPVPENLPTLAPGVPFPLALSTTWIYEMNAHTNGQSALWRITQTIQEVGGQAGILTAKVSQQVTLLSAPGSESGQFFSPQNTSFWYILNDNTLFRSETAPDLNNGASGSREIVWPPESVTCWCVNSSSDGCLELEGEIGSGCRYQAEILPLTHTPAGDFSDCRDLRRGYNNGGDQLLFCPNVGIVSETYQHLGDDFGYRMTLIGYSLPSPER